MASLLRMPEVAANGTEAGLQEWAVAEGAEFAAGDVLATVETDKAVVEVEAEGAGVMLRALVTAGASVEVGSAIAVLAAVGETVTDTDAVLADLGVAPGAPASGRPAGDEPSPGEAAPDEPAPDRPSELAPPTLDGGRVFASPLARRLAATAGIAIEQVPGTGPGGRVRRRDVEAAQAAQSSRAVTPAAVKELSAAVTPPADQDAPPSTRLDAATAAHDDVPHSRMRRAIASRLLLSKQTTPHFYLRASVRVDELVHLRSQLNDAGPATRISVNDLVLKAAACAHGHVPDMNAIWTDDALRRLRTVDIAVAVATPGGLLTPVLRDVASLSVAQVASSTKALVERARAGTLTQAELEGGASSVTNLGMYGTEEFAAIINPPQSSILAVGAVRQEPVVVEGRLTVGALMRVTLSVDHRAVDGAVAASWLAAFVDEVEHPVRLLL